MNERIKLLAEQAGVKMNAYGRPIPASLASNFDEFAELIVQECARVANDSNQSKNRAVGVSVGDVVREHFGVEEQSNLDNVKAGADIHAGDGGYKIGTIEGYQEFVKKRNAL